MTTEVLSPPDVPSKFSLYHALTLKIIRAMSEHHGRYEMPWHSTGTALSIPMNAATNEPYRGANIVALWAEATARGYSSPLWAGYKQWQSLGAQVRNGQRGSLVVFFKRVDPAEQGRDFGLLPRFVSRAYWVFNASQVDNFVLPEAPEPGPVEVHDDVEAFVRATDARIGRDPERAYYNPQADTIHMVDPAMFCGSSTRNATEAYYAVLLHELTHWTAPAIGSPGSSGSASATTHMRSRSLLPNSVPRSSARRSGSPTSRGRTTPCTWRPGSRFSTMMPGPFSPPPIVPRKPSSSSARWWRRS